MPISFNERGSIPRYKKWYLSLCMYVFYIFLSKPCHVLHVNSCTGMLDALAGSDNMMRSRLITSLMMMIVV